MAITLKEGRPVRGARAIAELPDGTRRWFEPFPTPLFDERGALIGGINMLLDITSQIEADEALHEANQRKDDFLALLAHELRNPLGPILNCLHILRESAADRSSVQLIRELMERQIAIMTRLVDDLMEVSRITHGKLELREELIDLAPVIETAVETSKPSISAAHHGLDIDLPEERLVLKADPVRLAQAIANLLNNAAKYTPDGGKIQLRVRRQGSASVSISVRDDGIGIPAQMRTRIFDLFTQVDRSYDRARGGLGIGLTLVKQLVELHRGSVQVHSDGPDRGAEFVILLPLAAQEDHVAQADFDVPRRHRAHEIAGHRILVVDDYCDSANSLAALLKIAGAKVSTAYDGQSALEAISSFRPSAVIVDIGMPGMDGYEFARRARERFGDSGPTLIALTGWGHDDSISRSREAGIEHHFIKPVDYYALIELLTQVPRNA